MPRKAVPDSRIFQLFRWRVKCDFDQSYHIAPSQPTPIAGPITTRKVPCGVIITNNDPTSDAPYALYNLEHSYINKLGLTFYNPLSGDASIYDKTKSQASCWYVNIDTVTDADLAKFRILIWAPTKVKFDFGPYQTRINYFAKNLGGYWFIDTNNTTAPHELAERSGILVAPDSLAVCPGEHLVEPPHDSGKRVRQGFSEEFICDPPN